MNACNDTLDEVITLVHTHIYDLEERESLKTALTALRDNSDKGDVIMAEDYSYHGKGYPAPSNGDVAHCEWYLSNRNTSQHVTVHLWPLDFVEVEDSWGGIRWLVRHCVVCGTLDRASLERQDKELHKKFNP